MTILLGLSRCTFFRYTHKLLETPPDTHPIASCDDLTHYFDKCNTYMYTRKSASQKLSCMAYVTPL